MDTCLDLIALQYTCMIVMAMLAFFVFVSRYYVTCRNRQFEQSRWMIVVALLLFVVHYMCQMRLGWRQQGNDVGVLFNLLFYSPSAILLSWSQLNILRAGHGRWCFMRYGVAGYALMVLCIVAGVISNGSLHIGPMLYVADAIFFLNDIEKEILNRENVIITPHEAEFSRFSGYDLSYIKDNRLESLINFYEQDLKYTLVLKGKNTIMKSKENCIINNTGNCGMATAGSGDCLTGIILSLIGQGLETFNSAKLGVFLHGLAGDFAKDELGEDSLIASDIIKFLPKAIKYIRG